MDDGISTEVITGLMVVAILPAAAQVGRQRIFERTKEWRMEDNAKAFSLARKPNVDKKRPLGLHDSGMGATETARQMKIGRPDSRLKLLSDQGN